MNQMLQSTPRQILPPKQLITTESSGSLCVVEELLGSGGQGEVYRADLKGKSVALKWYYPATATREQRLAIEMLVRKAPPNGRFLWPMELATAPELPGFGYIMPLREPRFHSIVELMKRRVDPSFKTLATAGLDLSHSFLLLHAKGLCYRDISFDNVFFDPASGEILICDNDNVGIDGATEGDILGTPRFMAPEVVRGEAMPSTHTDLFSLSILLFCMFLVHHPLEGRREYEIPVMGLDAMTRLYGTEPLFIFDPEDASNAPVPGYHDNALAFWPIYPQFLRRLFVKAFTVGLRDPHGRVRESEWRAAMVRLRDSIFYCPHCAAENFYDADAVRSGGLRPTACWACAKPIPLPPRMRIGRNIVMLNHDTRLYPHHVDDQRLYDFSYPVAAVVQHPQDPRVWGLKNLTTVTWSTTTSDHMVREVQPGRSVTLAVGSRINFGRTEGEIR